MVNLYGIIPLRKADVKNPVLDYEWKGNSDFDYASALFKISSFTNTAVGGIATSYDAAEKRKGKLKKRSNYIYN